MLGYNWAEIDFHGDTITAVRISLKPGMRGHSVVGISSLKHKTPRFIKLAEDPRLFVFRDTLYCSYTRALNLAMRICMHRLDSSLEPGPIMAFDYGTDVEKNWCFFERDDTLYTVYSPAGFTVLELECENPDRFSVRREFVTSGIEWDYGEARGSTPPVLHEGRLTMFFHSSRAALVAEHPYLLHPLDLPGAPPWPYGPANTRIYYIGYCEFEPASPFRIIRRSLRPILLPGFEQYRVIFPGSAIREVGGWRLACGLDDYVSATIHVTDAQIQESLEV